MSDNNAVLGPVKLDDHRALGITDVFAKNLKHVLSKEFLENKSTEWVSILPKIIENIQKAQQNGFVTDLEPV